MVSKVFGINRDRMTVIPNGIVPSVCYGVASRFRESNGISEDFVLCVGRIEPRKNQVRLIKALDDLGLTCVFIGAADRTSDYYRRCREAGKRHYWLSPMPYASQELADAYAAARVLAQPSLFETPGLAALEGAAAGCAVVASPNGGAKEYLGGVAHFPKVTSVPSIKAALAAAWVEGRVPGPRQEILDQYEWSHIAKALIKVYGDMK